MRGALLALLLIGCGGVRVPEARDEAFSFAVERQKAGDHEAAAAAAWQYFRGATVEDPRYDRDYTDQVSAKALSNAVSCLWDEGLFACAAPSGFGLLASTAAQCSAAATCAENLGASFAWSATGSGCGPTGCGATA